MDAIRVAKVQGVLCSKAGSTLSGTLHLTAHHLIFHYDDEAREEMWVPYPLISLVTRLPLTLQGLCPLTIRTRTFETFSLLFPTESDAVDVFDSVKELTVAMSVNQLYAFFYVPNPPYVMQNGWFLYSPREEFGRMGVGTRTKAWRFTDINKDYAFSPTYPARLVVPTRISDTTLQYAAKYRSKCRIPVLTYLHWANFGTLTRSSQPMVGLTNNRSIQDEKLIEAIFQTHHSPDSRVSSVPVYGATATNLIIDARPTTNAMANTAKGAGTENMDHYKDAKKAYLGIDHIHVMRESLAKVVEALRETEIIPAAALGTGDQQSGEDLVAHVLDRHALRRSGWLKHISAILEGTLLIVRNVHVNSSHVLIHCSDGWDRTAQLSSLSQLCLDPFYRTVRGFQILVEKDWLSFGHKFLDRCGHLSSDKFFLAPVDATGSGGGTEAAQAFLASVQNRFSSQGHLKEMSPVFHQFLESVRQVQRQFPERFEFNERFLRQLHYHLYSCQFGTFLFNSERERRVGEGGPPPCDRTISVWDFFNSPPEGELNLNPSYDPSLDDPLGRTPKADMGVLMPNPKDVRFWHELYGRTDEEMNGKFVMRQLAQEVEYAGPVQNSEDDPADLHGIVPLSAPPLPTPATSPPPSISVPQPPAREMMEGGDSSSSQAPLLSGWASTPDLRRTRHESVRAPHSVSDSPMNPTRTPSPGINEVGGVRSSPLPRGSSGNQVSELFSSGGVRSMWGRFSSNASAAFSVVQDAYGGMAKDLNRLTLGGGNSSGDGAGGELKTRDEIGAWGEPGSEHDHERRPSSPRGARTAYTFGSSSNVNPWSTTKARPNLPSMVLDNPWSSLGSPTDSILEPGTRHTSEAMSSSAPSPLPADPTVELPGSLRRPTGSSSSTILPSLTSRSDSVHSPPLAPLGADLQPLRSSDTPASSSAPLSSLSSSTDPLGVGLL
ncbi:hypothetical protein AcV5_006441 [Taiwanofungus camphoratus]|nr:hypothetical protein AcV5_006441 [Antrodia cinnamomea]